jgi:hypothetical protein
VTVRINDAARNAAATAIAALVDGGAGAGNLRVYSGAQPATPATAPSGTLLLDFTLSDPAFGAPAAGTVTLDITPAVTAVGLVAAEAGWFRLLDSTEAGTDGQGIVDGSVTAVGGGGDVELDTTTISVGVTVTMTALTLTMPATV